jgi:hypothetical protein
MFKSVYWVAMLGLLLSAIFPTTLHEFVIFSAWALSWSVITLMILICAMFLFHNESKNAILIKMLADPKFRFTHWALVDHAFFIAMAGILGYYYLVGAVVLLTMLFLRVKITCDAFLIHIQEVNPELLGKKDD